MYFVLKILPGNFRYDFAFNNVMCPVGQMEVVMSCSWSKSFAPEMDSLVGTRSMLGGVFVEGQELNIQATASAVHI